MPVRYLVSYSFGDGFGRCEVSTSGVSSIRDVERLERKIKEENGLQEVVILNVQRFPIR